MSSSIPFQVLLAVADRTAASYLAAQLRDLDCQCQQLMNARGVDDLLRARSFDLLLVEMGEDEALSEQVEQWALTVRVIVAARADPELFFVAAKAGVEAVICLPLNENEAGQKLRAVFAQMSVSAQGVDDPVAERVAMAPVSRPRRKALHATIPQLFATSEEMTEVRDLIEKVAPTSATVLLRGESGVGKELAARLIHSRSLRAERAFVKVNCAAIPNELLESELFGFEAGAFTGAVKGKPGKFELADGGSIFLDEIGEMHPMLQAKLLHVLQDGDFARLGSKRDISADVRVICATNQPLDILVREGRFREDLYYRVNVVTITLPPLRARKGEIPQLLDYFLQRYSKVYGKTTTPLSRETVAYLIDHDWPGNIRELENLCKRYVIVGGDTQILRDLAARKASRLPELEAVEAQVGPTEIGPVANWQSDKNIEFEARGADDLTGPSLLEIGKRAARAAERTAIEEMLRETRWNRREAARRLKVSYKALLNKIQTMECGEEAPK